MIVKISALFILSLFTVSVFAQDCKSPVTITTNDSSSVIFIDKGFTGKGKVEINLAEGKHLVSVRKSVVKWNGFELSDTINISNCPQEYIFNYNIPQKIYINTKPQNAGVIVNDSLIGYTPLFVGSKGLNSIKFKKDGLFTNPDINLLRSGEVQTVNYKPVPHTESFTNSTLFKVMVGTVTVLGATAAYFKLKADNRYDDYLLTKDKSTLDEVDRLDVYSGVAFGLLQINFGYLVYRFITD